jgi:hypothetical protein
MSEWTLDERGMLIRDGQTIGSLGELVAEVTRLREALRTIIEIGETRDVQVARAALGDTPNE